MKSERALVLSEPPQVGGAVEIAGRLVTVVSVTDSELTIDHSVGWRQPQTTYRYEVSR